MDYDVNLTDESKFGAAEAKGNLSNRIEAEFRRNFGLGKVNEIILSSGDNNSKINALSNLAKKLINYISGKQNEEHKDINKYSEAATTDKCIDTIYAIVEALHSFANNSVNRQTVNECLNDIYFGLKGLQSNKQNAESVNRILVKSDKMRGIFFESLVAETGEQNKQRDTYIEEAGLLINGMSISSTEAVNGYFEALSQSSKGTRKIGKEFDRIVKKLETQFYQTFDYSAGIGLLKCYQLVPSLSGKIPSLAKKVYQSALKNNEIENCLNSANGNERKQDLIFCAACISGSARSGEMRNIIQQLDLDQDFIIDFQHKFASLKPGFIRDEEKKEGDNKMTVSEFLDELSDEIAKNKGLASQQNADKKAKLQGVKGMSYTYEGTLNGTEEATYIGGNMGFGAQLPDHCITKNDIEVFDKLIKNTAIYKLFPLKDLNGSKNDPNNREIPQDLRDYIKGLQVSKSGKNEYDFTLSDLSIVETKDGMVQLSGKGIEAFMKITDAMIRTRFNTQDFCGSGLSMEKQALQEDSCYNDATRACIVQKGLLMSPNGTPDEYGTQRNNINGNSLTNITSLFFESGMGDCRHHAQIKQILFDRWKNANFVSIMREYGRSKDTVTLDSKVDLITRVQLRTFDAEMYAGIAMRSSYRPDRAENGKFKPDPNGQSFNKVEEHTLTMLVVEDGNNGLQNLYLADAFYQNPDGTSAYDLGYNGRDISGNIKFLATTAEGVEVEVPTSYGGKKKMVIDIDGLLNGDVLEGECSRTVRMKGTCYCGKRDHGLFGRIEGTQSFGIRSKDITSENVTSMLEDNQTCHEEAMERAKIGSLIKKTIVARLLKEGKIAGNGGDISHIRDILNSKAFVFLSGRELETFNSIVNNFNELKSEDYYACYYKGLDQIAQSAEGLDYGELISAFDAEINLEHDISKVSIEEIEQERVNFEAKTPLSAEEARRIQEYSDRLKQKIEQNKDNGSLTYE